MFVSYLVNLLPVKKTNTNIWIIFIITVFCVKIFIFLIDPLPMFLMGDSHSYITTSLTGWIPPDRSFTYGYFIKYTAVASHSLTTLILLQTLLSGTNAILLSYMLIRFFSVRPLISFLAGILCSVEPLQLLYERYVMTESLSLFLFVLYLLTVFLYIEKPNFIKLFAISFIGIILVSVRMSFLPIVLINTIILPLLAIPSILKSYGLTYESFKLFLRKLFSRRYVLKKILTHIVLSIVLTISLHSAYRHLNGYLSENPPAYLYHSGFFLLAYFAPIIEPVDFPNKELADKVYENLKYDLLDYHKRAIHHWEIGGLVEVVKRFTTDSLEADHIAKQIVINALKRDPLSLFSIAKFGFLDYWNITNLKNCLKCERGEKELPDYLLVKLRNYFSLWADELPFLHTFTNKYFFIAWPWYLFLLCSSLIALLITMIDKKNSKYFFIIFISSLIITSIACILIEGITVRYLHPASWLIFLMIVPVFEYLICKLRSD
ncbi:MAG: hypothetical protein HXY52_01855 [Nitrospirae bacterium]|nr:hypothetical protein [Nitrospirota bacterium]